jgi:hypothetical protein
MLDETLIGETTTQIGGFVGWNYFWGWLENLVKKRRDFRYELKSAGNKHRGRVTFVRIGQALSSVTATAIVKAHWMGCSELFMQTNCTPQCVKSARAT